MTERQFCKLTKPAQLFFLVEWEEGTHSIVCGKDVDGVASSLKKGDVTWVKVSKEWYAGTVLGSGEKREMIMLQDTIEDTELEEADDEVDEDEEVGKDVEADKVEICADKEEAPISPSAASVPVSPAADSNSISPTTPRKRQGVSGYPNPAKQRKGETPKKGKRGAKGKVSSKKQPKLSSKQLKAHAARQASMAILAAQGPSPPTPVPDESLSSPTTVPKWKDSSKQAKSMESETLACPGSSPLPTLVPCESDSPTSVPVNSNMQLEGMELENMQLESNSNRLETPAVNLSANYHTPRPSLSSPLSMSFHSPTYPFYAYSTYHWGQNHPSSRDTTPLSDVSDGRRYQELSDMLLSLKQQFSLGMNNLHSQIDHLSRDFSDFKYSIFKKKSLRKTVSAPGASASPAQSASSPPGWSTAEIKEQEEIGCWFGNQSKGQEEKAWVVEVTQTQLRGVDCQLRVKDLCRKLVELLFTEDDLRSGNDTEARTAGVKILDSHKLYAIRVHYLYRFPEEGGLNSMAEKER